MTVVQNRRKIAHLEIDYTVGVLLNTLTMKQLTTSLYLISNSACYIHFSDH